MPQLPAHPWLLGLGFTALVLGSGCMVRLGSQPATPSPPPVTPAAAATASPSPGEPAPVPVLPGEPAVPVAAGLSYPRVPAAAAAIAALLASLEPALRSPATPADQLAALGHQQQVIYRVLAHRSELAKQVRAQLPPRWQGVFDHHLGARREFLAMHPRRQRPSQRPAPAFPGRCWRR